MKKVALIMAGLLMFTLSACKGKSATVSTDKITQHVTVSNSSETPATTVNIAPQIGFFAEDDNYIFSTNSNGKGITRVDKKTGESKSVYDKESMEPFCLTEKSIYFLHQDVSEDKNSNHASIWRIDKDGSNLEKVLDENQFPESAYVNDIISGFAVNGNRLFVSAAYRSDLYLYDMNTKVLKMLSPSVWNFHVVNDTVYYSGKPWKGFTVYKRDLKTMKEEAYFIKGDNESDPAYDGSPVFIESKMYLLTTPYTLSVVEDGDGKAVFESKDSHLKSITGYKGNIYFVLENNDKTQEVYKFDTTTNTAKKVADINGGNLETIKLIIDGHLYYFASVNIGNPELEKRYVKLVE